MKPVMYWGDTECLKGPRAARKAREDSAIAQRRVQLGMTQRQLADALEIGVSAVRSWEQGTRQPGRASLIKLSAVLHCTVDELIGASATEHSPAEHSPADQLPADQQ